jgi:hypothetical protein
MKHRRVVHKSTAGILKPVPEAVGLVGNPPPGLTNNTVALPVRERPFGGHANAIVHRCSLGRGGVKIFKFARVGHIPMELPSGAITSPLPQESGRGRGMSGRGALGEEVLARE